MAAWLAALTVLLATVARSQPPSMPVKVVIDTDIGSDNDDTFAVAYALSRPDLFDVVLVSTVSFNTTGRACILAKMLTELNRTDVPIAVGVHTNGTRANHGVGYLWDWVATYDLSEYPGVVRRDGIRAMHEAFSQGTPEAPVYGLGIGANTNFLALLDMDPAVASKMRLVSMSGCVGDAAEPWKAEWNVLLNTSASEAVYETRFACPKVTAPLDTTLQFRIDGTSYERLLAARSRSAFASVVIDMYTAWWDGGGSQRHCSWPCNPKVATTTMHDLEAAHILGQIAPLGFCPDVTASAAPQPPLIGYVEFEADRLFVNGSGFTVRASAGNTSVPWTFPATRWRPGGVEEMAKHVVSFLAPSH